MYRIGELAQRFQIKTDTLRYYEKHGLLAPSERSESGYRIYSRDDELILSFILRAKSVGFTLAQIQELLTIETNRSSWACQDVKSIVEAKVEELEQRITELSQFRDSLQQLAEACCGGPESAENCSILDSLEAQS